ncbi:MAG: glycosyltransferase family 29 protein [Planctomycetota bacterium]|nr:glycosyltransferase family 29 protein [Planctomycetota bacterium]
MNFRPRSILIRVRNQASSIRMSLDEALLLRSMAKAACLPDRHVTNSYGRFLKGKRVALVGPAPTIEGSGQADHIESHDVIVRLNHALPVLPELQMDVGQRTDVLYHNLWRDHPKACPFPELFDRLEREVQWVCAVHPHLDLDHPYGRDIDCFVEDLAGRVPFHVPGAIGSLKLHRKLCTRPNAGVCAIVDLLGFKLRSLYITGFTFYEGSRNYHVGYVGNGTGDFHDQDRQRAFITRTIHRDPRVRVDEPLRKILEAPQSAHQRASKAEKNP